MKKLIWLSFLLSSSAYSTYDFQVLSGRRIAKVQTNSSQSLNMQGNGEGSSMTLAAHWNLDSKIPVAIGGATSRESLYFTRSPSSSDILYGYNFQLEVYAWLPMKRAAPYARISSLLSSQYHRLRTQTYQPSRISHNDYADSWSEHGQNMAIGCAVTIAPAVGALIEYQRSFNSFLQSNLDQVIALNSQSLRAGIEIGL